MNRDSILRISNKWSVSGCTNGRVNEHVSGCTNGRVSGHVSGCVNDHVSGCSNGRVSRCGIKCNMWLSWKMTLLYVNLCIMYNGCMGVSVGVSVDVSVGMSLGVAVGVAVSVGEPKALLWGFTSGRGSGR